MIIHAKTVLEKDSICALFLYIIPAL